MAGEQFRATLRGDDAVLGAVRSRDVAQLMLGLETALAAAAYATLGKPRRSTTGRHVAAVEAASRLRFEAVASGSVEVVLRLPDLVRSGANTIGFGVDDLAGAAFDRLVATFSLPDDQVDVGVARALADLGDTLGIGERYDALLLTSPRGPTEARLDGGARERLHRLAEPAVARQADAIVGTLREADFDKGTARLQTPAGEAVTVAFGPGLADDIQDALRAPAEFEGVVTVDATTSIVKRVDLRRIIRPDPLPFDAAAFWTTPTVADLAAAQGIEPARLDAVVTEWTDEDRADLAAALADLDA